MVVIHNDRIKSYINKIDVSKKLFDDYVYKYEKLKKKSKWL